MFTPQQIDQISFSKAKFGGYDMQQVDEILEPLTEDYVTLYKENALLKSKMRVLVGKLEEYRKNESAMKDSMANAKRAADKMMMEAQEQCNRMLANANANAAAASARAAAAQPVRNADALIAAENARVEEARRTANAKIAEIQAQMHACIQALDRIKSASAAPAQPAAPAAPAAPVAAPAAAAPAAPVYDSNAVADEIAQNLEAMVGTTEDFAPVAPPRHPTNSTTSRFSNLNLQFGANYDPTHK